MAHADLNSLIELAYFAGQHSSAVAMQRAGEFFTEVRRRAGDTVTPDYGTYIAEAAADLRRNLESEMARRGLPTLDQAERLFRHRAKSNSTRSRTKTNSVIIQPQGATPSQ